MIEYHSRYAGRMLAVGTVFTGFNLFVALSTGRMMGMASGLICLAMGILLKTVPVVSVDALRVETRKAPLRPKQIHSLGGIEHVGPVTEKTIAVQTTRESFEIPVGALSETDRLHLYQFLLDLGRPQPPVTLRPWAPVRPATFR